MRLQVRSRLHCPACLAAFRAVFDRCPRDGTRLIPRRVDPLIGATLADRYVIEALVGEGAMALVYRAHHARLSRLFAVKIMFGDVAAESAMRLRFAREADRASRLCHPNVISVVDFGRTERGLLYLAMDYVEGETLASLISREGPLDCHRVVALTRQLCRGLSHAHCAGLVHRDFKPANVAVSRGEDGVEQVRILDFGLAISERESQRGERLTEHGQVVGTPIYIAPEQARDRAVDHRADLFALGVVMYEMLAGRPPFDGSGAQIARANAIERPPPLRWRNPQVQVDAALEAIVSRLLEKRPSERFQTAEDVAAALDEIDQRPGRSLGSTGLAGRCRARRGSSQRRAGSRAMIEWLAEQSRRLWRGPGSVGGLRGSGWTASSRPAPASERTPSTVATWGPDRDQQATARLERMAGLHVDRAMWEVRRAGLSAATWLALATAGMVLAVSGGSAGETEALPAAVRPAVGASDVRERSSWWTELGDRVVREAGRTAEWLESVPEETAQAEPRARIENPNESKMVGEAARRCPNAQHAEHSEAVHRDSRAPRAARPLCPGPPRPVAIPAAVEMAPPGPPGTPAELVGLPQ